MPRQTIQVTPELAVLHEKYRESRDHYDRTPVSDRLLRATHSAHRLAWGVALAEALSAEMARGSEPTVEAVFRPKSVPPVAIAAADEAHRV